MYDLIALLSMILLVSPILIGAGAFGLIWLRDEFYKHSFYETSENER